MQSSQFPNKRDFSYLDKLSTEELEALICQDFQLEEETESDLDMILYITEVLENRRRDKNKADDIDIAWKSFNENYRPYPGAGISLFEFKDDANVVDISPAKPAKKIRIWARVASSAAIIAIVLVAGTATAQALGFDLLGQIAHWTKDTFGFVSQYSDFSDATPVFESLEITLNEYGVMDSVLPTWIPDVYECEAIEVDETPQYIKFLGKYRSMSDELSITINHYRNNNNLISPTYEIDEGAEIYVFNEIEHYIMVNSEFTRISWIQGANECSILCSLSKGDAEKIIDSIYERK